MQVRLYKQRELKGKKVLHTAVKSLSPTAETIDLLVKMLPYGVYACTGYTTSPLQTHSVHLSLYYVMAISRQVISFFWTDPNDTLWIRKAKGTESSLAKVLLCSDQKLIWATLPISQMAGKAGFLQLFLLYEISLSSTLLQVSCYIRLKSHQFKGKLKSCSSDEF